MSEKKYVLPQKMVDAAYQWCPASFAMPAVIAMLEAAVKWLAENPVIPTRAQVDSMVADGTWNGTWMAVEWQRRCFLAEQPEYRQIELTQGQFAIVDKEDYERLNAVEWYARRNGNTFYAERHVQLENGLRGVSSMHREVTGAMPGEFIDHADRNGLHNWKTNLRRCNEDQNKQNVGLHSDKQTSKYKGVCRNEVKSKFMARIGYEGKMHHIGYFDVEEEAALAYDREARIHHGEFAYLNFPEDARMFLAPEPDGLESLLSNVPELVEAEKYKRNIIEAYELGKKFR